MEVAIYRMGNRPGAKIPAKRERKWNMAPALKWQKNGRQNGIRAIFAFFPFLRPYCIERDRKRLNKLKLQAFILKERCPPINLLNQRRDLTNPKDPAILKILRSEHFTTVVAKHYDGSKTLRRGLWNTLFSWGKITEKISTNSETIRG